MNKKHLMLFLLPFCLTGCLRVGPPYRTPEPAIYDDWTQADNARMSNSEDNQASWSSVFEDPQLKHLTEIALQQNYSLKAAAWRIGEARALVQIATGQFFPQTQQAFGSWENIRLSKNAPNTRFADRRFRNALLGFTMSWELDFWGRFKSGIDSADFIYQASEADYFGVQLILTSDIAKTYILLCTALDTLRVIKENIRIQKRSLEIIRVRLDAGLVSELDLQQAQVLLSTTESQLPITEREVINQQNALAVLLGTTPDQISAIIDTNSIKIPFVPPMATVGIPAHLLCRRPDLIAARNQILSQTALVGVAETDLLPHISLFGVIGVDAAYGHHLLNTNANKKLFSSSSLTAACGPDFNWPLLNYGRLEGRVELETARLKGLMAQYLNLVLQAYQEAENAMAGFIKAHDERVYLEEALKASQRAASLSEELYREGLADYERVLEAQRSLLSIQDQYVVNNGNIALFFVQIYQALGGTLYVDCN